MCEDHGTRASNFSDVSSNFPVMLQNASTSFVVPAYLVGLYMYGVTALHILLVGAVGTVGCICPTILQSATFY
jgi:hypothetical protein